MRSVSKALRFPLQGLARDSSYRETTYPTEERTYGTPMAVNVIGPCAFEGRNRGGSRPGLKAFTGTQPGAEVSGRWLWPNGEAILWPDGARMIYSVEGPAVTPDGSVIVDQHLRLTATAAKGAIPESVTAFAFYRDRHFVASGSMWYASRTGEYDDFDYGGDGGDVTRPAAGNVSFAGRKAEDITAFIPVGDESVYIATSRSLRVISGEPTTGPAKTVSEFVGIISRDAWCNAEGDIYFMGQNGLYGIVNGTPMLVSQHIPEELKGLASALLVYDPDYGGIHIFTGSGTSASDWFYDIVAKAFWPVRYPSVMRPAKGGTAVIGGVNRVIFLCADGVWRYWDDDTVKENGEFIRSEVAIGPFKCSQGDDSDGMLDRITATLAGGSADVGVGVYMANGAEESVRNAMSSTVSPDSSMTAKAGWNNVFRTRCRGAWATIVLTADGKWAYESLLAVTKLLGGLRNG